MEYKRLLWLIPLFVGVLIGYLTTGPDLERSFEDLPAVAEIAPVSFPAPTPIKCSLIKADELLIETNKLRKEAGVAPLTYSETLERSATLKAKHMAKFDYNTHIAPDGTKPEHWWPESGYGYLSENLSWGWMTTEQVIGGWAGSEAHLEALLDAEHRLVGFGVYYDTSFQDSKPSCLVVGHYGNPL